MFEHHIEYFISPPVGGGLSLHGSAFLTHRPLSDLGEWRFVWVFLFEFIVELFQDVLLLFLLVVFLVLSSLCSLGVVNLGSPSILRTHFICSSSLSRLLLPRLSSAVQSQVVFFYFFSVVVEYVFNCCNSFFMLLHWFLIVFYFLRMPFDLGFEFKWNEFTWIEVSLLLRDF